MAPVVAVVVGAAAAAGIIVGAAAAFAFPPRLLLESFQSGHAALKQLNAVLKPLKAMWVCSGGGLRQRRPRSVLCSEPAIRVVLDIEQPTRLVVGFRVQSEGFQLPVVVNGLLVVVGRGSFVAQSTPCVSLPVLKHKEGLELEGCHGLH